MLVSKRLIPRCSHVHGINPKVEWLQFLPIQSNWLAEEWKILLRHVGLIAKKKNTNHHLADEIDGYIMKKMNIQRNKSIKKVERQRYTKR